MGIDDWAAFLHQRPIAVFVTEEPDAPPHAVAVEVVVRDGRPHIWCRARSRKARNALLAGRASIAAYKGQLGVLVRGAVEPIPEGGDAYDSLAREFLDKYDREETYGNDLMIAIAPEHVTTWD